jgi:hypothetical protein
MLEGKRIVGECSAMDARARKTKALGGRDGGSRVWRQ